MAIIPLWTMVCVVAGAIVHVASGLDSLTCCDPGPNASGHDRRCRFDFAIAEDGFGTYTREVIRSEKLPYGYEVQLYALAGQEGVVGLILMLLLVLLYFRTLWPENDSKLPGNLVLGLLLLVWFSAGLFNPMLLNSAAAISYAAVRSLANLSQEAEPGDFNLAT